MNLRRILCALGAMSAVVLGAVLAAAATAPAAATKPATPSQPSTPAKPRPKPLPPPTHLTITAVSGSRASALALGRALMANPKQLLSAEFALTPPDGTPRAIGRAPRGALDGFPRRTGDFAILSNGCAVRAAEPKYKGTPGCDDGGGGPPGSHDASILRLTVNVPSRARCLWIRFRFLSNEYPKFVGSPYNDAFVAETGTHSSLSSPFLWAASSAPQDFATTAGGQLITVNSTGYGKVHPAGAVGTGYNAGTQVLRASTPISRGHRFVFLSIFDGGDRQYDSAVLLDQLTLDKTACTAGVTPGPH